MHFSRTVWLIENIENGGTVKAHEFDGIAVASISKH